MITSATRRKRRHPTTNYIRVILRVPLTLRWFTVSTDRMTRRFVMSGGVHGTRPRADRSANTIMGDRGRQDRPRNRRPTTCPHARRNRRTNNHGDPMMPTDGATTDSAAGTIRYDNPPGWTTTTT